ncbi:muscle M-line assembly protein unc-89-like isoform X4 [Cucurbita moschata]|uniref:Muscle M-line assembly protein unc-89-like isoform X4 n=1 Tax=Cucurbita moschata TaxID=3662 RepID=A0A6J1G0U8_CUCMO|nr:muscle M-line assembly protein unc-89-like isoform X4 [Cucurbita moschata]
MDQWVTTDEDIDGQQRGSRTQTYLFPLKSQSSREKTTAGWLGRQFLQQMSRGNEFSDDEIERVTAVAAAAYAIHSIQNSEIARRRKNADYPETSSFPKFTHLKEDNRPPTPRPAPEPAKLSRRLIDKDHLQDPEQSQRRNVSVTHEQPKRKPTENTTDPGSRPYFKETAFSGNKPDTSGSRRTDPEKPSNISGSRRTETEKPEKPSNISGSRRTEPEKPAVVPRPPTPFNRPTDPQKPLPTQTRPYDSRETKADQWEKAEMAKINERFHKVIETVSYWERKKRDKARRKYDESQAAGVKRSKREKGIKKFEEDMDFIKQIAEEARAKADQKRRNDILKANQKADIIRQTGDLPVSCSCC